MGSPGPTRFRKGGALPGRAWAVNGALEAEANGWGSGGTDGSGGVVSAAADAAADNQHFAPAVLPGLGAQQFNLPQWRPIGQVYIDGQLQQEQNDGQLPPPPPAHPHLQPHLQQPLHRAHGSSQHSDQPHVHSIAGHSSQTGLVDRRFGAVLAAEQASSAATLAQYSSGDEERGGHPGAVRRSRPGTPLTPGTLRRDSRLALLSMVLLVFQGTALSIMLRYSRARAGKAYLASVSVILTELIKLVICVFMQYRVIAAEVATGGRPSGGSSSALAAAANGSAHHLPGAPPAAGALAAELRRQAADIASKSLPMLLPAGMFVMQQVLLVIAATHLDAVAFQIFSQSFKLVPTALFAYWLLGQTLEPMQWGSIPVLAFGVVLVTVNNGSGGGAAQSAAAAAVSSSSHGLDYVAGMVACSISGLSSAYAGVYFEKYVKGKHAASLWVRNIQLGLYGVPLSTGYAILKDGWRIRQEGLFQGFDAATWMVIALQVFGGLVTGMVVKYCDNILKNFALAVSVILTVLVAIPLFGQWPSPIFLIGVALVLLSVFMYGRALDPRTLQLYWQRARKRFLALDAARSRRTLVLAALGIATTLLLITGALAGRRATQGGKQLTQRGAGRRGPGHLGVLDVAGVGAVRQGAAGGSLGAGAGGGRAARELGEGMPTAGGSSGKAEQGGSSRGSSSSSSRTHSGTAGADSKPDNHQQRAKQLDREI